MTHPEELLAGHVDGALSARDRATIEAHLADCARCRREVALAASARSALGSLAEVPAPSGLAARALAEARSGRPDLRAGGAPRWYRIAGIAAAAAGLLVVALTLPHIGRSSGSSADERRKTEAGTAGADSGAFAVAATVLEIEHVNYDETSLAALSASYAREVAEGGVATGAAAPLATGSQKQADKALACIVRSAPDETGQLTHLIRARFQATPAYLAVFLEGPGADQPPDAVAVWVFASDDCRILSSSFAQP